MNKQNFQSEKIIVGVVGQGVMGAIISSCFLAAGHEVRAVSFESPERRSARARIKKHLHQLWSAGEMEQAPETLIKLYRVSAEYSVLAPCGLVVESIIEDVAAKRGVIEQIEAVVSPATLIGSNTSALPITLLQAGAKHPERVLGLHWLSSSPFGRAVEVMGGENSSLENAQRAVELLRNCGRVVSHVQCDKRGFLGNRIFYAMLREAFALVDEGTGTPEEIDAALQESVGLWLPFAGPFAYLDLCGPHFYPEVMRDLNPDLSVSREVPRALQQVVENGGQGVFNGRGFYEYSEGEATRIKQEFDDFRRDLRTLMRRYEAKRTRRSAGRKKL